MSLRRRLTIAVASAVALSIALACVVAYFATRSDLRDQVDDELREQASFLAQRPGPPPGEDDELPTPPGSQAGPPSGLRVEGPDGEVLLDRGGIGGPGPGAVGGEIVDGQADGEEARLITVDGPGGQRLEVARSLEQVNETLAELRGVLLVVMAGGVAAATLAARAIATRILGPVAGLTAAAEHVTETEDLSRRIEVEGDDEVASLGHRFNTMLGRLEESRTQLDEAHEDQRRLIADASHELRTPVTALRTNIEVIASGGLGAGEAARALGDAAAQAEELGLLIGDLMDLARGEPASEDREEIRLDAIVAEAVDRARRHAPGVEFTVDADESVVEGSPERIARALNNLLDNAAEHGGGTAVEVSVASGVVRVRDHGPGLDPAEAARLFDRFYRGSRSRSRPGSGLGLAIVRQVAEAQGGSATAAPAAGGGAEFILRFGP